jgi:hypothetical protein
LAQAEAGARLQVVKTEMEARSAEMGVLALATGSESELRKTDRAVLRKMRHADEEVTPPLKQKAAKRRGKKNPVKGAA